MRGVFLDTATLGADIDFSSLHDSLDRWQLYPATAPAEVAIRLAGRQVAVTNKVVLDADILAQATDLKLICLTATGTNNVDLDAARRAGIAVCNVRDYAGNSVAQHVLALLLGLATQWHRYDQDVRDGHWSSAEMFCLMQRPVVELAGKTFGIIGYGALGKDVAQMVSALKMKVLIAQSVTGNDKQNRVPLAELLAQSDVVSLHCPLTADNTKMVDAGFLQAMKPGAFLINTARGGLIDEAALRDALLNNVIGGAALDVLSNEPPQLDHPLLAQPIENLIVTPHNAWISLESRQRLLDQVADNIGVWRHGGLKNCVNGLLPV